LWSGCGKTGNEGAVDEEDEIVGTS
jgi:hypothetical protein